MDFLLVGFLLWGLLIAAVILLILGLWKNSWKALLWSGIAFLPPMLLIALGHDGFIFKLALLIPAAVIAGAVYMKKRMMYFM
ncbi:hypothetical protein [Domibacillus iocasae]|jgi:hypothetical protein|uniref:Uncharacterized protein n=1 Tax=Domibacillus iocasae TaxID=1714016 RepID=A0A1E7DTE0_9BACI|nr:hypothetical protein [Domibacillus iocasae]OES46331.1 hypothetical protein BA724_15065 [Domibacillus iocasae]